MSWQATLLLEHVGELGPEFETFALVKRRDQVGRTLQPQTGFPNVIAHVRSRHQVRRTLLMLFNDALVPPATP